MVLKHHLLLISKYMYVLLRKVKTKIRYFQLRLLTTISSADIPSINHSYS